MQILGYSANESTVVFDVAGVETPDVGVVLAAAIKTHPIIAMWRVEPEVDDDCHDDEIENAANRAARVSHNG